MERVTKRERAICRPDVLRQYLILKKLKHVFFAFLISIFAFTMRSVIAFADILKRKKHQNQVI